MSFIERQEIADGVFFSSVRDDRFKVMRISVNMIVPLSEESASANALLCGVLSHSCGAYPDFTEFSRRLASLYGADIDVSISKFGDNQVLRLSASGIDDRYAFDGTKIAEELSNLLCGVIFEPNITNGEFPETDVEQERRQLLELAESEFNDKRTYALSRMIETMCADEVCGIKRYGSVEKIKQITSAQLCAVRENILKTARFEIMYIGESPADGARNVFADAFSGVERSTVGMETKVVRSADKVGRVVEESDIVQAKLVMGFRTDCAYPDEDVTAMRLMCAVLGGTASSKLFCNVREKQSLCYYCSSRFDTVKGIMIIDSGVEKKNIEKAESGILKEIEEMRSGNITDFEIEAAKLAMINSYRSVTDTVGSMESWYTERVIREDFETIEQKCSAVSSVTKEQIIAAANKLTLDTVYLLRPFEKDKQ